MDLNTLPNIDFLLSEQNIVFLFVKAFGLAFGTIYLFFAFIFVRQVGLLNKIVRTGMGSFIEAVTLLQIPIALFILFLSWFLL